MYVFNGTCTCVQYKLSIINVSYIPGYVEGIAFVDLKCFQDYVQ